MNLIIKNGILDRYATNEDFNELETIINDDLRRILIYLSECNGEKEDLINAIEKIRKNISNRHTSKEDLEISLVDNYVVFNLTNSSSNPFENSQNETPEIVIMKRNMRGIYFLRPIEKADILTEREEYLPLHQIRYHVDYYDYSRKQITSSQIAFSTYVRDDFEEPFFQTEKFMDSLNKSLSKIVIFNSGEHK